MTWGFADYDCGALEDAIRSAHGEAVRCQPMGTIDERRVRRLRRTDKPRPDLIFVFAAQVDSIRETVIETATERDIEIGPMRRIGWKVEIPYAEEALAVEPKSPVITQTVGVPRADQVVVLVDVGQLIEAMKPNFRLNSQPRGQVVIRKGADSIQSLPAKIRIEVGERRTDIQLLIASLTGCYDLGSTYRREKEESGE